MKTGEELCEDFIAGIKDLDDAGSPDWPDALANVMFSALTVLKARKVTFGGMSTAEFLEDLDQATDLDSPYVRSVLDKAKIARN